MVRIFSFPLWWYFVVPSHFPYLFRNINLIWEDLLAIRLMAKYLFVPLYHDMTFWGRIISFAYRLGRIIAGAVSMIVVNILLTAFFILWLIAPFYLFYKFPETILLFITAGIFFTLFLKGKLLKNINDFKGEVDFKSAAQEDLSRLFEQSKTIYEILINMLNNQSFQKTLVKAGLSSRDWLLEIEKNKENLGVPADFEQLRNLIIEKARFFSSENLKISHLFLVLLDTNKTLEEIMEKLDMDKSIINQAFAWCEEEKKLTRHQNLWDRDFNFYALSGVNRTLEGAVTPSLEPYVRDLTREAKRGVLPSVVKRKDIVDQIAQILSRSSENNVILVGEPGCGKTYLVYGLAEEIINGGSPPSLRFKRIVSLDYSALLAGTKTEGEILGRMKKMIDEIEYAGNIILFLDEIQNLVGGDNQRNAVYSALEPHLSSSKFQVVATTSFENYHSTIEQNGEFANLFQKVEIPEATKEETLAILESVSIGFEKRQKVTITYPALLAAIELSGHYIQDRVLPEKAVSILDEAAVIAATHSVPKLVGKEEVAKVIAVKTHLPVTKITVEESNKLLYLEKVLHQRMIDQNEAVSAVSDAMRRARAGIREESKPIASFLFVGPTGVGKTELARTLAEFYFGSEETMIRLDMSEFQTKESVYSLIGPPLGQKGSELGGRLTEAIRRRPFSLLLLDEIEKAHPDVLNLFLQVMDEARLTSGAGRTVDFSNAIIIATSNAGTNLIQEEITKNTPIPEIKGLVNEFLKTIFKPEFLNRFDGIIVFKPLSESEIEMVAQLLVKKIAKSLSQKGILVEVGPGLLAKLAKLGYDPTMGARPLRRLIQDKVEAKIAKELLKGELKRGKKLVLDESILNED